jgi:hypothetical protein
MNLLLKKTPNVSGQIRWADCEEEIILQVAYSKDGGGRGYGKCDKNTVLFWGILIDVYSVQFLGVRILWCVGKRSVLYHETGLIFLVLTIVLLFEYYLLRMERQLIDSFDQKRKKVDS